MGSKLSLFRRTVEIEDKESENLNNKVSSSEVTKPTQPSEPTPISGETEKVEQKCGCVDCKCDPCGCPKKDTQEVEAKVESTEHTSEDKPQNENKTEEPEVTTVHIESLQINEESAPSTVIIDVVTNLDKPSEEPTQEVPKEEPKTEETSAPKCCQTAEEVPKDQPQEKKCLCDPCECNPCKCCGQDSEVTPNEAHIQESEAPEAQREELEKPVTEAPEHENQTEEQKQEIEGQEQRNEESVAEARDPIENVENVPQESNQGMDVQKNE